MLTLPNPRLLACLPALLAAASCVPPVAATGGPALAASSASPEPGFSWEDMPPPVSSLGRLAPAEEARWRKAAHLFAAPSAAPAAPFRAEGDEQAQGRALGCLTAAVYYEARSEGVEGQRAVAQVVLNRVRHPAFPASICGVVYQGSGRRTGCQFSFTCDGSTSRRREPFAWERARAIASAALNGEVYAAVGNATHYHTRAILPYWAGSLSRAATVGSHIFYRWRGGAGQAGAFRQDYAGEESGPPVRTRSGGAGEASGFGKRRIERVATEGATVTIHRGAKPGEPVVEQLGVRIHAGAPPALEG